MQDSGRVTCVLTVAAHGHVSRSVLHGESSPLRKCNGHVFVSSWTHGQAGRSCCPLCISPYIEKTKAAARQAGISIPILLLALTVSTGATLDHVHVKGTCLPAHEPATGAAL